MLLLGAGLTAASVTAAASTALDTQILKSDHPQNDPKVISFLKEADNSEKFLFFREAFEEQKLGLFNEPAKYLSADFPLKDYVTAWTLLTEAKKDPSDKKHQADIQNFIQTHKADYIAERVKTDWLLIMTPLWHKQNQWQKFRSCALSFNGIGSIPVWSVGIFSIGLKTKKIFQKL